MKSLIGRIRKSPILLRIILAVLPALAWISRGDSNVSSLAYRVYSVTPSSLASQAAKSARLTARQMKDPFLAGLHRIVTSKFLLDSGGDFDKWSDFAEDALDICDRAAAAKLSTSQQADLLLNALSVLFHSTVHQGAHPSPFVDNPELTTRLLSHECLSPFNAHQSKPVEAASHLPPSPTIPQRLLVLTDTNFNFMSTMLDQWEQNPLVSMRVRNLHEEAIDSTWWNIRNTIADRLEGRSPLPPAFLADDLEWADVVFVEWSQALAARLSGVKIRGKLFVRLHKYEAFIPTPLLTQWDQVEGMLTITPYMKSLISRTAPGADDATSIHLTSNVADLKRFSRPKSLAATRTLALVQYNSLVKDPMWALDVLAQLRAVDPSWKLHLVGRDFADSEQNPNEKEYLAAFNQRLDSFGDSVVRVGFQSDLPKVLQDVGVILSSSQVEGAPVSIQEGVASGAFPVIRNWPILKAVDAARRLYPDEWVVETPIEAAERILAWAPPADGKVFETESQAWMVNQYDVAAVMRRIDGILFQGRSEQH